MPEIVTSGLKWLRVETGMYFCSLKSALVNGYNIEYAFTMVFYRMLMLHNNPLCVTVKKVAMWPSACSHVAVLPHKMVWSVKPV